MGARHIEEGFPYEAEARGGPHAVPPEDRGEVGQVVIVFQCETDPRGDIGETLRGADQLLRVFGSTGTLVGGSPQGKYLRITDTPWCTLGEEGNDAMMQCLRLHGVRGGEMFLTRSKICRVGTRGKMTSCTMLA